MKCVVFDVDDTLYDQQETFKRAVEKTFQEEIDNQLIHSLYLDFRFFSDQVFEKTVAGELSLKEMRIYRFLEAAKKNRIPCTREKARQFQMNYKNCQKQIVLKKEMLEILSYLVNKEIALAVLTNGPSAHQRAKMKQLGLLNYIKDDYLFVSEEIGLTKPNPLIFKYVAETMSVEADDLIYVGDSYENDVVGSKKAHWHCIWLNKYQKNIDSKVIRPDYEMTSYKELKKVLVKFLERR